MDRRHTNPNHCAALDCTIDCGSNRLFCQRHAAMVPTALGDALRTEARMHRSGTPVQLMLIQAAVQAVAAKEGRRFYALPEVITQT